MTANIVTPKKLKQINVSIPADRFPELARKAAEDGARRGHPMSIGKWARRVLLDQLDNREAA